MLLRYVHEGINNAIPILCYAAIQGKILSHPEAFPNIGPDPFSLQSAELAI